MRNQTKMALVVSLLILGLSFGGLLQSWDYYAHQQIQVNPPKYETVERSIEGKIGQIVICSSFILVASLVAFILIAPKEWITNGN